MPDDLAAGILAAHRQLNAAVPQASPFSVAVRSSATAEDLKPSLKQGRYPILQKKTGEKEKTLVYDTTLTINLKTPMDVILRTSDFKTDEYAHPTNVKVMTPFCRTVEEGKKVIEVMKDNGLQQHVDDLAQLTLGSDRDSSLVAPLFSEQNKAERRPVTELS